VTERFFRGKTAPSGGALSVQSPEGGDSRIEARLRAASAPSTSGVAGGGDAT
jgi:hypothetical protein